MVTQEDTIFVSGMDPQTNEDDIANHFGAIGIIKVNYFAKNHIRMLTMTHVLFIWIITERQKDGKAENLVVSKQRDWRIEG